MSKWMFDMLPEGAFSPRPDGRMALHGGKGGSSAPPPDPRLIEAQIKSLGVQDGAIEQVLANSRELAPLQKRQLMDSLTRGDALYGQSQEDRTYGLQRRGVLTGLQDRLVMDANSFNEPAEQERMAAQAGADVNTAFAASNGMMERDLSARGVNPNSGNYAAMRNQNAVLQMGAASAAMNKTRQAARLEGFQLNDRATNAFAGYPSSTAGAIGTGLSTAGFGLASANSGLAGLNSGYGAAGGMAGQMGGNAANMYGAMGSYKSQQDKIAADSDPFAALLGAGAQIGAAYLGKTSDRRLKKDIVPVGKDARTGLTLYEFNYIGGDGTRYRGVMADEVKVNFPRAVVQMPNGYMAVNYAALGLEMVEVQGESA